MNILKLFNQQLNWYHDRQILLNHQQLNWGSQSCSKQNTQEDCKKCAPRCSWTRSLVLYSSCNQNQEWIQQLMNEIDFYGNKSFKFAENKNDFPKSYSCLFPVGFNNRNYPESLRMSSKKLSQLDRELQIQRFILPDIAESTVDAVYEDIITSKGKKWKWVSDMATNKNHPLRFKDIGTKLSILYFLYYVDNMKIDENEEELQSIYESLFNTNAPFFDKIKVVQLLLAKHWEIEKQLKSVSFTKKTSKLKLGMFAGLLLLGMLGGIPPASANSFSTEIVVKPEASNAIEIPSIDKSVETLKNIMNFITRNGQSNLSIDSKIFYDSIKSYATDKYNYDENLQLKSMESGVFAHLYPLIPISAILSLSIEDIKINGKALSKSARETLESTVPQIEKIVLVLIENNYKDKNFWSNINEKSSEILQGYKRMFSAVIEDLSNIKTQDISLNMDTFKKIVRFLVSIDPAFTLQDIFKSNPDLIFQKIRDKIDQLKNLNMNVLDLGNEDLAIDISKFRKALFSEKILGGTANLFSFDSTKFSEIQKARLNQILEIVKGWMDEKTINLVEGLKFDQKILDLDVNTKNLMRPSSSSIPLGLMEFTYNFAMIDFDPQLNSDEKTIRTLQEMTATLLFNDYKIKDQSEKNKLTDFGSKDNEDFDKFFTKFNVERAWENLDPNNHFKDKKNLFIDHVVKDPSKVRHMFQNLVSESDRLKMKYSDKDIFQKLNSDFRYACENLKYISMAVIAAIFLFKNFGKNKQKKKDSSFSHDRKSNIEIGYLAMKPSEYKKVYLVDGIHGEIANVYQLNQKTGDLPTKLRTIQIHKEDLTLATYYNGTYIQTNNGMNLKQHLDYFNNKGGRAKNPSNQISSRSPSRKKN